MNPQPNEYLDDATRFWTGDHDHATPLNRSSEDVDDDVQSAYRESAYRKASDADLDRASPHLEILAERHGSLSNGIDYYLRSDRGFKEDPIATAAFLKRDFKARGPYVKADPAPRPDPPEYLDERARAEWQREQDVRDAIAAAPGEAARRKQIEDAEPLLAKARREYGSIAKAAENAAAFERAAAAYPALADDIAEMHLARRPQESPAAPAAPAAQSDPQQAAYLNGFLGDVVSRNILPGIESIEDHVAAEITRLISGGYKGGWQELLVDSYWNVRQEIQTSLDRVATGHERAEGEKARRASRSLSSVPGGLDDNRPFEMETEDTEGDTTFDAARRAYRSVTGGNRI